MTSDFAKLNKYDLKICAIPRAAVLQLHLRICVSVVLAFSGGELVGYVTTQQYSGLVHIRPLHADNDTIATALVKSVLQGLEPGTRILICCPLGIWQQFWKQFGISSAEPTNLFMSNRPVDEPNRDGVYSHYNSWYMTMWRTPCAIVQVFNPLWSSDSTWRHGPWSILFHATICQLDHLKPTSVHLDNRIVSHGQHLAL